MRAEEAFRVTNSRQGCKVLTLSLKEQGGTITTNRERILDRCAEFYKTSTRIAKNIVPVELEEVPPILDSEIEHAIRKMKNRKAPEEDQVMIEILKARG